MDLTMYERIMERLDTIEEDLLTIREKVAPESVDTITNDIEDDQPIADSTFD